MTDPLPRLTAALADRYRIERELGQGGMATVYLAEDLKHRRKVAIKVLKPELAAALGGDRFLREIETTAGLHHPNILPLFDSGEVEKREHGEGGLLYFVMPLVEGESLRDRLDREKQLPIDDALHITREVADALSYAHAHGIVHRDIKPENIMLEGGHAIVTDFGIAKAVTAAGTETLTLTGMAIGTPHYMSPEQSAGERIIDGRSDVYALGCVLFEMLTGGPPFTGSSAQAIIGHTIGTPPPSARSRRSTLSAEIDAAITRALAKDPAQRFATPQELVEACSSPPTAGPSRRWLVAGALVTVVLVAAVAFPMWQSGQTARARTLLPTIEALASQGQYPEAYELALRAERRLAGDTTLTRLLESISNLLTITTDPEEASVHLQRLSADSGGGVGADSVFLGLTPVTDHRMARAEYRVVVRKEGYAPLERLVSSELGRSEFVADAHRVELALRLLPLESVPNGMVVVPGGPYALVSPDLPLGLTADLQPFFLDRFEVTNADYAAFLRSAGYETPASWRTATTAGLGPGDFTDRTGLPGPRDWVSQTPPAGTGQHPVSGVTWYEASAFCAAEGKRLPTVYEWEKAARNGLASHRGVIMPWGYTSAAIRTNRRANFGSSAAVPVDALPFGISPYGAYAMAGNVKEWLANPTDGGFAVAGGSWQDPAYLFSEVGAVPATAASPAIGLRCARTSGSPRREGGQGSERLILDVPPPAYHPVDDATFQTLLSHYRYDRRPANARGLERVETQDWVRERLWVDGVGRDSILIYLYLPNRARPPFQTLVYVPSGGAFFFEPAWQSTEHELGPLIKGGRAVLLVVLQGMIERPWPAAFALPPSPSVGFRDLMVRHATELRLGMDYLETRNDIDPERLAYVGLSFGAGSRLPFAAVDDRFRSVVLIGAGIDERSQPTLPEAANFNFAPHITPPKLMLNGRQDEEHPWNTRARPLWELLREPKELVLLDGVGHHPPVEMRVPLINTFLDRTLGPVLRSSPQN
ncbi:MAG: hypothetical protein E4H41_05785 [Gemmatimonadales bacterium]|nr:MAG: hypothetical protein E4H41_05785 [Gemmatimonadales bacterium]